MADDDIAVNALRTGVEDTTLADDVAAQLRRILASAEFDATERNRRFLTYVVEATLAGRAAQLKSVPIAQDVFQRDASFDPQLDPVVRMEAGRLRRGLERYYLTAGKDDPIRIDLPKGGYVPKFTRLAVDPVTMQEPAPSSALSATTPPAGVPRPGRQRAVLLITVAALLLCGGLAVLAALRWTGHADAAGGLHPAPTTPSIIIMPFENLGEGHGYLAQGLTIELVARLMAYGELTVVSAQSSFKVTPTANPLQVGRTLSVSFALKGGVRVADNKLRVIVQLIDVADGRYLWTQMFEKELSANALYSIQDEIADRVAAHLAAPYGVLTAISTKRLSHQAPPDLAAYQCVLQAYGYRRGLSVPVHAAVRDCLERTVANTPDYAAAWAQLAYIYLDEYRFRINPRGTGTEPLQRALAAARRAVELAGASVYPHLALSTVHHYRRELDEMRAEAYRALAINPGNPEVMAQVGWRLALTGDWQEGMALLNKALTRDPDPPSWYSVFTMLDAYRRADLGGALIEARKAVASKVPGAFVVHAAICGDLGLLEEAAATMNVGLGHFPWLISDVRLALLGLYDDAVTERIVAGLGKAGIAVH